MKQYTNKEQTAKLIELGFPKPKFQFPVEDYEHPDYVDDEGNSYSFVENYSIGELIEFLGEYLLNIGTTTVIQGLPIKYFVLFTKDPIANDWIQIQGELIDKLFEACMTLKEEGVI